MSTGAAAALRHRHATAYRQHALLAHAWHRSVLGGTPFSPAEPGAIVCAQFDSGGELLVTGSEEGLLTVHTAAALLSACRGGTAEPLPPTHQAVGIADPLLVLDIGLPKLQAVRWNGADENVVGTASAAARQVHLYDLQHTQVGGLDGWCVWWWLHVPVNVARLCCDALHGMLPCCPALRRRQRNPPSPHPIPPHPTAPSSRRASPSRCS